MSQPQFCRVGDYVAIPAPRAHTFRYRWVTPSFAHMPSRLHWLASSAVIDLAVVARGMTRHAYWIVITPRHYAITHAAATPIITALSLYWPDIVIISTTI